MSDTYQRKGNSLIFMGSDKSIVNPTINTEEINKRCITIVPNDFISDIYFIENTYIERVSIPLEISVNKKYMFKSPFPKNVAAVTQSFLYVNNEWIDGNPICDNGIFYGLKCLIYGDGYIHIESMDKLIHPRYIQTDDIINSAMWKIVIYG